MHRNMNELNYQLKGRIFFIFDQNIRMNSIKWGIIGCGNVSEVKSGPGFQLAKNSSLVAVMRRNAPLARDYANRHNVPKWYSDAGLLVHDPEVNAIYIATPLLVTIR